MKVFVKNIGRYDVTFTANEKKQAKDASGREILVDVKAFTKTFLSHKRDPSTGQIKSTGYTPIEEEEFDKLLEGCPMFVHAIKSGALVKHEKAPPDALLDSQLIENIAAENKALKKRVAELEEQLTLGRGVQPTAPEAAPEEESKEPELDGPAAEKAAKTTKASKTGKTAETPEF